MHAWLISEIYFDPITDSQFREIINNYTVILVATIRRSKIKRLRPSSFPSKLLLSGGKVDRCFHDLVYVLQFFSLYFHSLLFRLFIPTLSHPRPREAIRRTLIARSRSWSQREKWFRDFPRLHLFPTSSRRRSSPPPPAVFANCFSF